MKYFIIVQLAILLNSASFADFTIQSSLSLSPIWYPTGVTVDQINGHYWFSHNYLDGYGFSETDSEYRFKCKVIPQNVGPTHPSGSIGFGAITMDTLRNTIWVTDDYTSYIREFTKDGDLVSTFSLQVPYSEIAGSITYDSHNDTLWLKDLGISVFLYETSMIGEHLKTIRLDTLTTPIYASDMVYDINRDVLWLYTPKLVKLSTNGVILGIYNWNISQIREFSGMGYNPLTDRILITDQSYTTYDTICWEYTTDGTLAGYHVLNPYGYCAKGMALSSSYFWIISALDCDLTTMGIAKSDYTGRNLQFWSYNITNDHDLFYTCPRGIVEDFPDNSLWIVGVKQYGFETLDTYPYLFQLSNSGEYINIYSYPANISDFQGITREPDNGHLWIVESIVPSVSEFTITGTMVSSFPIGQTGCTEPRGITYVPDNDRLMVIDDATDSAYSFTKTGEYKGGCSIANITTAPEDISYEAPGIIWILEGQRAIRCFYEPPTSVVPTYWDGYH